VLGLVDELENARAVVAEPRAVGGRLQKIAEPAQRGGAGHEVFVGGVVGTTVLQQAAGGIALAAGEPALEGVAEQLGRGETRGAARASVG